MTKFFIFGEILFDLYSDKSVIGGAPFNFCAHMSCLNNDVSLLSAVGKDELGEKAKEYITKFHIDDKYIVISDKQTGICKVSLSENNTPEYNLIPDTAYDNIVLSPVQMKEIENIKNKYLYFGTLAQRNFISSDMLKYILENNTFKDVFYDVNIRQKYYSRNIIDYCLKFTTVFKLSREEAGIIKNLIGRKDCSDKEMCISLSEKYRSLKIIILTMDSDGAVVYDSKNHNFIYKKAEEARVVSTVGAGDSFFAAFSDRYIKGYPLEDCLNAAVILSSYVVGHIEAVPEYSDELKDKLKLNII